MKSPLLHCHACSPHTNMSQPDTQSANVSCPNMYLRVRIRDASSEANTPDPSKRADELVRSAWQGLLGETYAPRFEVVLANREASGLSVVLKVSRRYTVIDALCTNDCLVICIQATPPFQIEFVTCVFSDSKKLTQMLSVASEFRITAASPFLLSLESDTRSWATSLLLSEKRA
jgi:hypothetical protein